MSLNGLSATTDINTAVALANSHKARPELFYDKQLLDTIRLGADEFKHYRLADETPIQGSAEKLQVRRWSPLQAHTIPLVEGVPPISDKGSVESYEIGTHQYGRFMEFSDKVDFEIVDPVIAHYTKEYSIVAIETLDLLARETLMSVGQEFFAGGAANFAGLTMEATPTLTDLRMIVLAMKKALVKPRSSGNYHVLGTPEFFYDMVSDPTVEKYMTFNNTTKTMYDDGMLVPMFNMEFYEVNNAEVSGEYTDADGNKKLRVYRVNSGTGEYEYADLDGATYRTVSATGAYVTDARTGAAASYMPAGAIVTWDIASYNEANGTDGEYSELKVHPILVVGAEALTRTCIAGQGNAKMYTKQKGSTGVLDPIDQRQSIGFKINSVGFGSVRSEAVCIYYCVPTNANLA